MIENIILRAMGETQCTGHFRTLLMTHAKVEFVLGHQSVQGVALTGSERAGRAVAALAGSMLKKYVVELGGNDGYLILNDADIDLAVEAIVKARLLNVGQSCIGPKRLIVLDCVKAELEQKLIHKLEEKSGSTLAPLVHVDAKLGVESKVKAAIDAGANCIYGDASGGVHDSAAYYNPVVLTDIKPTNPSFDVEIFGPVFSIIAAKDLNEAIALHNESSFGLGGAVFSKDEAVAKRIAESQLDVGMCFVNDFVRSDASLPFGGIKNSGVGRECSAVGVHEFMNMKTICVA